MAFVAEHVHDRPSGVSASSPDADASLFTVGAKILELRRWIVIGALTAAFAAAATVLYVGRWYSATATFTSQGNADASRAGLAALAGQFGVNIGSVQPQQSPDYFASLALARVVLDPIAADSFVVDPSRGKQSLTELLHVRRWPANQSADRTLRKLRSIINVGTDKKTGIVTLTIRTHWPVLSYAIASQLLVNLNRANLNTRQSQASEERRFTEQRLQNAKASLRDAEDRLQGFQASNRRFQQSPELEMQQQRLQREVSLQQQMVLTLTQAYEQARITEARDIPVLVPIDQPRIPEIPDSPGRVVIVLAALLAGAIAGGVLGFLVNSVAARRTYDPDAAAFFAELHAMRRGLVPRARARASTN